MNTHNPYYVRIFIQRDRFSVVHVVFLQLFHITDKVEQAVIAVLFISRRFSKQHFRIGKPLLPGGQRRYIGEVIVLLKKGLQKL